MTKYAQNFSAKFNKFIVSINDDILIVLATAIFAITAQTLGILP